MKCALWAISIAILIPTAARAEPPQDDKPLRVFQLAPKTPEDKPPVISSVTLSHDGRMLATCGDDHLVRVWSIADGKLMHELRGHVDWVRCVLFSPDDRMLVSAGDDRRVRLWDVASGQELRTLVHDEAVYTVAFSQDGRALAAAGFEKNIRAYDGHTGELIRIYESSCHDIRTVAFSPTAGTLAAAGRDGQIHTWNTADGNPVSGFPGHPKRIRAMAFSFDGLVLASAGEDRQLRIWNAEKGDETFTLGGPQSKLLSLVFCGTDRLAIGGSDNKVHLWDLTTRQEIRQFVGHKGSVTALACDCNNGLLVSGSFDTTVRVWQINRSLEPDSTTLRIDSDNLR